MVKKTFRTLVLEHEGQLMIIVTLVGAFILAWNFISKDPIILGGMMLLAFGFLFLKKHRGH